MTAPTHPSRQTLWNGIKDRKFAMFTTLHANGYLHSRPMAKQNTTLDVDDSLWFFMSGKCHPVAELAVEPSVTGTALIVEGGEKAKSLWNRSADAWLSGGPTDPDPAVVQVRIVHVSEWEAGAEPDSRPALRSEDVGFRPPVHLPTETKPASENAALLFERS